MGRRTTRVVGIVAGAALVACSSGPTDCNLVGCESSVVLRIAPRLLAGDPEPTVELCFDEACSHLLVHPTRPELVLGGYEAGSLPMPDLDPERDHVVTATYVGVDGLSTSIGPETMSRSEPNGHGCGPTCFSAELQLG